MKYSLKKVVVMILGLCGLWSVAYTQEVLDLAGEWQFQLDPQKIGMKDAWFLKQGLEDKVVLPGTTDTNKKGYKTRPWPHDSITRKFSFPEDFEKPEWIYELNTAPSQRYKYIGPAWYQREIDIPNDWNGKGVELFLERSLFKINVWVDGVRVGEDVALYTPRLFDLTPFVKAGKKHRITICVDNTNLIGGMAHGYTYHTQTNWNGVVGKMELRKINELHIRSMRVFTDIHDKNVRLEVELDNHTGRRLPAQFKVLVRGSDGKVVAQKIYSRKVEQGKRIQEIVLPIDKAIVLWDEFTPELYRLELEVQGEGLAFMETKRERFAFRKISTNGTQILVNDRPVFLRGTLDCAIYPKTGYMPMDRAAWEKVLGTVKEYGMNHLRYHSVCPPKVAFDVADEMGIYLQAELLWGPEPTATNYATEYLYNEGYRVLNEYGNHPSFVLMALSNELSYADLPMKNRIVDGYRKYDPRRLYATQAGHVNKMHTASEVRFNKTWENEEICNIPREELIESNDFDFAAGKGPDEPPLVIHENGQWVMYPGFDFMKKFDGVIQPDNFVPMYDRLLANGLAEKDREMAKASGRHGVWHIKQVLESMYRTGGVSGYQYLGLQDFPGQSEAMVGILDPFWDSKGYVRPEEFRSFCSEVVPLVRMKKWTYTTGESLDIKAEVWNFGPADITGKRLAWAVYSPNGEKLMKGKFEAGQIKQGESTPVGSLNLPLDKLDRAGSYTFELALEGTAYRNTWDFYVYPVVQPVDPKGVHVAEVLDEQVFAVLESGGKVLLQWPLEGHGKNVQKTSFTPHFWSFNRGALGRVYPGTAGMLCDPDHPVFKGFETRSFADPRWMHMIHFANAFILNDHKDIDPLVQIIDDYHRNNKLAAVFELRVGKGKLMVCGLDLVSDEAKRPEIQHFKNSLLAYMQSDAFDPKVQMDSLALESLIPDPKTVTRVLEGSSRWPLHDYRDVLDGDPATFWSSEWNGEWRASKSHYLIIELPQSKLIQGCTYTPRQDSENGRVGKYELFVSMDGKSWGEAVASGSFENGAQVQQVKFEKPREGKFVKFVALEEVNKRKWAAIADLDFF
ncbi:discoidin domain-containing protein [Sphingobacterium luzhongxinii]|uniref:discoidin domain-containing protein n=1 Tax=Sphingobacterium luzhongxinii TaxID=2654181 RepID=UPI0013DCD6E6|nr:discoidin domain-containing protein [Sphingobacterium sp. xlx-73]